MRERPDSIHHAGRRTARFTVDVVAVASHEQGLSLLSVRAERERGRDTWELPWTLPRSGETLDGAARRALRTQGHPEPAWMEQVGAFADGRKHPGNTELSVCFVAIVNAADNSRAKGRGVWIESSNPPVLSARQRTMADAGLAALRARMDYAPIPFRLLPALFTLSDLQQIYELLLARRLHKASFRRALHAAWLVEPTDAWRSEGRGRPAQLFRYAPRKRRGQRRAVRFDLL